MAPAAGTGSQPAQGRDSRAERSRYSTTEPSRVQSAKRDSRLIRQSVVRRTLEGEVPHLRLPFLSSCATCVSWRTVTAEKLEIEQLASLWTPGQSVTPIGNLLQELVVDKKEVRDSFLLRSTL